MHTNRHHAALTLCIEALSKGRFGSSLISMDGCNHDRLLDQGIQVPENTSRAISHWVFPNGTASPVGHQAALVLYLRATSQADKPTSILPRFPHKIGTSTSLNLKSALTQIPSLLYNVHRLNILSP